MKKFISHILTGCVVILSAGLLSVAALSIAWFNFGNKTDKEAIDGEVGLRGYYYAGNGSKDSPYEIVTSTHFYNLTRLQNLGIYKDQKYFQIGHDFGGDIGLACINYENGVASYDKFIDMRAETRTIYPIGNESTPFVGHFNGNGIPVRNLTVTGYPEDIGVFGYVDYSGSVDNLVCDNLTINSLGYTATRSRDDYTLFSTDIDDLFSSTSYFATEASLSLMKYSDSQWRENNLKIANSYTPLNNLDGNDQYTDDNIYKYAYFKVKYPSTTGRPFKYSLTISSGLLVQGTSVSGFPTDAIAINLGPLASSSTFNAGDKDYQVDTRISIVASVEVDDHIFSRVIQSYTVEFHSNEGKFAIVDQQGKGAITAHIFCDYVNNATTNYHHGNNIGFLAGHVNGSMQDCYVYNSSLVFNQNGYTPVYTESDTGLIGEIGKNIVNGIDPQIGLNPMGDTGIINFTRIYNKIREDTRLPKKVVLGPWYVEPRVKWGYDKHPKFYARWHKEDGTTYGSAQDENDGSWGTNVPTPNDLYVQYSGANGRLYWLKTQGELGNGSYTTNFHTGAEWNEGAADTVKVDTGNPNLKNQNSLDKTKMYYDKTANIAYRYNSNYTDTIGEFVLEDDDVFCGQGIKTDSTLINYISYDRFKRDGLENVLPDFTSNGSYNEYDFGDQSISDGSLFLDASAHVLYQYDLSTETWNSLNALVSNKDPRETNVIQLNFPIYEHQDYYYINSSNNFVYKHTQENDTFSLFSKYMRRVVEDATNTSHYVTGSSKTMDVEHSHTITSAEVTDGTFNSVDFIWNQIIEDEDGADRGLGVFKIITAYNEGANKTGNYNTYQYDNIGESRIVNGSNKTKVYFSTAEYDYEKAGVTNPANCSWKTSSGLNAPLRATSIPSYYDANSFEWPFSRDYSYLFELDLSQMGDPESQNDYYMRRCDCGFLNSYLESVLYDKTHTHLKRGDERFGFGFFRGNEDANDGAGQLEYLTSLSSYMPVGSPYGQPKSQYNGKWYPPNSIAFSIENMEGANVAVVGNGDDITIYSNNASSSDSSSVEPKYSMRSTTTSDASNRHRFFTYDYLSLTGETTTKATHDRDMQANELYGHIFFLKQGDYVIGANSGTSNIYFLSVQGQTGGNVGDKGTVYLDKTIEGVDFLTDVPSYEEFQKNRLILKRGHVSFAAVFNDKFARTFYVKRKEYVSTASYYVWFDFSDTNEQFVKSFITYSKDNWQYYIQNVEEPYHSVSVIYRQTG